MIAEETILPIAPAVGGIKTGGYCGNLDKTDFPNSQVPKYTADEAVEPTITAETPL